MIVYFYCIILKMSANRHNFIKVTLVNRYERFYMKKLFCAVMAVVLMLVCVPVLAYQEAQEASLRPGDKGYEVRAIQTILQKQKYYTGEISGIYDRNTEKAVKEYQQDNTLENDGIVNKEMLVLLGLHSGSQVKCDGVLKANESLRLTASNKGKELALIQAGTNVELIKSSKGWSLIRLNGVGVEGYIRTSRIYTVTSDNSTKLVAPQRSLARGESSADVATLQQRLTELGYYEYSSSGSYGSVTYMAIRAFQKNNDLEITGVASIETMQVLFSDEAQPKDIALSDKEADPHGVYVQGDLVQEQMADFAQTFLGIPYILGAKGPNAYDCSGFTSKVFKEFGVTLPRPAYGQGYTNSVGQKITKIADLRVGDLVFFNTNLNDGDKCDHVGIFIGEGRFVHASFSEGQIIISDINKYYWRDIFSWGRRVEFN